MTQGPVVHVVGRGRMGTAFIAAFQRAGLSHHASSGRNLAADLVRIGPRESKPVTWLIAVTDTAIAPCAQTLVDVGAVRAGDVAVHLAGVRGPDELAALREIGAGVGALHPLVAVSTPSAPPDLRGSSASFEGDAAAHAGVLPFAHAIGLDVFALREVDRAAYHAAAALVATGSIALAQGAAALFAQTSPDANDAARRAFIRSLLMSAAHNVSVAGPADALASPILRGDTNTIGRHLEAMRWNSPASALYRAALAQVMASLRDAKTVDPRVLDDLENMLARDSAD